MWQHIPAVSPFIQMNDGESIKSSISQIYKTPIKRAPIIQNCELASPTPYKFDFNMYFGHLFSSGNIQTTKLENYQNSSQTKRKENYEFFKNTLDKSAFKVTPNSEYRVVAINSNENYNSQNNQNFESDSMKINLNQIFDKAKSEKSDKSKSEKKKKINNTFLFNSPSDIKNDIGLKKIFECSGNTACSTTEHKKLKRKRFRKNEEQLVKLINFFKNNKDWSKDKIKCISAETGLKEAKVYKWLWDQKNKELKNAKFFVKKDA